MNFLALLLALAVERLFAGFMHLRRLPLLAMPAADRQALEQSLADGGVTDFDFVA